MTLENGEGLPVLFQGADEPGYWLFLGERSFVALVYVVTEKGHSKINASSLHTLCYRCASCLALYVQN